MGKEVIAPAARPVIQNHERAISALTGYVAGSFVVVPFDRIKTLQQATPGERLNALQVARSLASTAGLRGFYRGLDTQLLIAPFTVFYYTVYDELLQWQGDHALAPLYAAALARTAEVTVRTPLELLRTQLQAASGELTLRQLVKEQLRDPLSAWTKGYTATLVRDVPFSAIYWFAYEKLKPRIVMPDSWTASPVLSTLVHSFCCGGIAGCFAAFVTTPVDVVKTLKQKIAAGGSGSTAVPASSSYRDICKFMVAYPRSALAGVGPRLLRIPLGLATMMAGIETCKGVFQRRRNPT